MSRRDWMAAREATLQAFRDIEDARELGKALEQSAEFLGVILPAGEAEEALKRLRQLYNLAGWPQEGCGCDDCSNRRILHLMLCRWAYG